LKFEKVGEVGDWMRLNEIGRRLEGDWNDWI
jgi:hypothetical protein